MPISQNKTFISQILLWIAIFILFSSLFASRFGLTYGLKRALWSILIYILLVNANMYWLMPKFLYRKRNFTYFSLTVGLFLLVYLYFFVIHWTFIPFEDIPSKPPRFENFHNYNTMRSMVSLADTMIGVLLFVTSIAYSSSQLALKKEREAIELKNENLDTELKFLRSQINPHFLFNALHNIYTLSMTKSDRTPKMIIMLSDMLRFVLYDCKRKKVMIKEEIAYLKNFIELTKLKDDGITNIETRFDVEKQDLLVEPMLFIPFLENCFKHSKIEDVENGWIKLTMHTTRSSLSFELENSISKESYTKDNAGGIGLENVQRRLALLYPDKHELNVSKREDCFSIQLDLLV